MSNADLRIPPVAAAIKDALKTGALAGTRVVEFASLGPAPFTGMMLADHGAEVICITRPNAPRGGNPLKNVLIRSRRTIALDLRKPEAIEVARDIVRSSDALIEGYRPGVMERLGLGPEPLLELNPRLVYGRMTGWGQSGPMTQLAGHDINYIALSGALSCCQRSGEQPSPPANMLGDFGGGGMLLAFGIVAGILSARTTGHGQVVDAAMTDGSALLTSMIWTMRAQGRWDGPPGENLLDTGAPFYDTYQTRDGLFIAVGAIEPQFYRELIERLDLSVDPLFENQMDRSRWPAMKKKIAGVIARRSRADWCGVFADSDACVSPILSIDEAAEHPHNTARQTFTRVAGTLQPSPAPRFAGSGSIAPRMPESNDGDAESVLMSMGYDRGRIRGLREVGVFGTPSSEQP
jgi:alpha-methylacyl-CoA racemase